VILGRILDVILVIVVILARTYRIMNWGWVFYVILLIVVILARVCMISGNIFFDFGYEI